MLSTEPRAYRNQLIQLREHLIEQLCTNFDAGTLSMLAIVGSAIAALDQHRSAGRDRDV